MPELRRRVFSGVALGLAWVISAGPARAEESGQAELGDVDLGDGEVTDIVELDLEGLLEMPVVTSASKRKQAQLDAPMEVTLIEADEIASMAVDNVAEVMRWVPGAHVLQSNANAFGVGLRGVNRPTNNHVLTLLDGRPLADLSVGLVPWGVLPIHPGDVARIEVVHGPGSTLYGANALSGVINIVSKRPLDQEGAEVSVTHGVFFRGSHQEEQLARGRANNGGSGYAAFGWINDSNDLGVRVSVGMNAIPGWDEPVAETPVLPGRTEADDQVPSIGPSHGQFGYHAMVSGEYRASERWTLFASLSRSHAEPDVTISGLGMAVPMDSSENAGVLTAGGSGLVDGLIDLTLSADARELNVNLPYYAGLIQEVKSRAAHGTAQIDLVLGDRRDIFTLGVESKLESTSNLFAVNPESLYAAVVIANELRILSRPKVLLSTALRLERIAADDGHDLELVYRNLSPRAALVANFSDRHAVRLAAATAYRTPTPFETFITLPVPAYDDPYPVFDYIIPNPAIRPTEVKSIELGYEARPAQRLQAGATLFAQRVDDLVDVPAVARVPVQFDNIKSLDEIGLVTRLRHSPEPWLSYCLSYVWTYARNVDTKERDREWPTHIAGAGVDLRLPHRLRLGSRLQVTSTARVSTLAVSADGFKVKNEETPWQGYLNLRFGRFFYDGKGELFIAGRNLLGIARDIESLHQHPSFGTEPIGTSVILGVNVRDL